MIREFIRPEDGLSKDEKKEYAKHYQERMTALQQNLKNAKIPVVILIEGAPLSGRSVLVNELIAEIDPRFSSVFVEEDLKKKTLKRPFIEPFFNAIPENGKVLFMDGGWVSKAVRDYVSGRIDADRFKYCIEEANLFERQLRNNGYLVLKFFICTDEEKRKKSFASIEEDETWAFVDTRKLKKQLKKMDAYLNAYDSFLSENNPDSWNILDGNEWVTLKYDTFKTICESIETLLRNGKTVGRYYKEEFPMVKMPKLAAVDLSPSLTQEEYKAQLKAAQERVARLHGQAAKAGIPLVVAFEGWDAAGKGSAIRRLAYPLDPRLFTVYPIASPEPHEKNRHHLWRFWQRMPQNGKVSIFDRTWYGRVMVERLEGYCSSSDWKRAYAEINEFEKELTDWGAVVIKFWLQVDKDTQLARFEERKRIPAKRWKITDEDWRNRDKWDQYEEAADEMIKKTSTTFAPWTIVEANSKYYARIKVLNTVADRLEEALNKR